MKEDFTDFIEVSGLLNYDPDTISKIYKKNPKRLLKRLWQTLIPIFTYIFSVGWDKLTGRLKNKTQARFRARELTNLLVELGPAFVKAGQALSTRPDIIPGILLEELSELQDQLPGFDGDKAMELIEEDLGALFPIVIDFTITLVSSCLCPIFLLVFFLGRILYTRIFLSLL